MHQILGLRPWFNKNKQEWDVTDGTFFKRGWKAASLAEIYGSPDAVLEQVEAKERVNLFYTVAHCGTGKREFLFQDVMVFDVDKIRVVHDEPGFGLDPYIRIVCEVLGVKREQTGLMFSGNGIHFVIGLKSHINDPLFFDQNRRHYIAIVQKIDQALLRAGLPGAGDPSVFDARRIMRMPHTLNKKEGRPERRTEVLQANIEPIEFDITTLSGLPLVEAADHVAPGVLKRFPKPDTPAVLAGCDFLKHCGSNPNDVPEENWYAMLSIVGRLEEGHRLAHEYSKGYTGYSPTETDAKLDQALTASGPRTCQNINRLWGKCAGCKHFEKVTSPVMIRGENFIKTKDNGFHEIVLDKNGNPRPGKPCYEDLRRFFEKEHRYITVGHSKICLIWTGKHWEDYHDTFLEAFAQQHFFPHAHTGMTQEFKNLVCRTNSRPLEWFTETTARKMNFNNGVLDLDTLQLSPHTPDAGFRYVLPYDYEPGAEAPRFEKFLDEIMCGRAELKDILMEFIGYSFSGDPYWLHKCLIMTGEGSNGKSTLMNIMKKLAGDGNYSSLTMEDLQKDTGRNGIDGKLFNLSEETPARSFMESSMFKNLTGGGETQIRQMYKQGYSIKNKCKMIYACNELPDTRDTTRGFFRRLIIVPFEATFEGPSLDPFIEEKLTHELPGIFNLVIAGYQRLKKNRKLSGSQIVAATIDEYREDVDSVVTWYRDCVDVEKEFKAGHNEAVMGKMYAAYGFYAEARGERPEKYIVFAKRLRKIVPGFDERLSRKIIDGKKERVLAGVRFGDKSDF